MFNKKGQSALEFLTTYGWAFLVALIMIGALAYFGVLNPSQYLPERCNFGTEIGCEDFLLIEDAGASDEVSLSLMNNMGETVILTRMNVTTTTPTEPGCLISGLINASGGADINLDANETFTWKDGQRVDFAFQCTDMTGAGVVSGGKSKIQVDMDYYSAKSSASYLHNVKGEVYAQVQ